MISSRMRTTLVTIVTTAWIINFGAGFFNEDYQSSDAVNGIFMLIVGAIFAAGAKSNGGGGDAA